MNKLSCNHCPGASSVSASQLKPILLCKEVAPGCMSTPSRWESVHGVKLLCVPSLDRYDEVKYTYKHTVRIAETSLRTSGGLRMVALWDGMDSGIHTRQQGTNVERSRRCRASSTRIRVTRGHGMGWTLGSIQGSEGLTWGHQGVAERRGQGSE
jgi:hypothetical protein